MGASYPEDIFLLLLLQLLTIVFSSHNFLSSVGKNGKISQEPSLFPIPGSIYSTRLGTHEIQKKNSAYIFLHVG
jgi:hypothetical protein